MAPLLAGSPFKVYSDQMGSGTVTAFGPGLSNGQVGTPATFTLVTRNAAPGMHCTHTSTESAFDCIC